MNVIIVGCGRLGVELATRLDRGGHAVCVVDPERESLNNLAADFGGRFVIGEALERDVLERAGITTCDALAALTAVDTLNAAVAHVARTAYAVPKVFVRNYDPRKRALHEACGHQTVSSITWSANRAEDLLYNAETNVVFSAGGGEVELHEALVPAAWAGRALADLAGDDGCRPVALTHAGAAALADPATVLAAEDLVLVAATKAGADAFRARLRQGPEA